MITQIELIVEDDGGVNGEKLLSIDNRADVRLGTDEGEEGVKGFESPTQGDTQLRTVAGESIAHTAHLRGGVEENALFVVENDFAEALDHRDVNSTAQRVFPMDC